VSHLITLFEDDGVAEAFMVELGTPAGVLHDDGPMNMHIDKVYYELEIDELSNMWGLFSALPSPCEALLHLSQVYPEALMVGMLFQSQRMLRIEGVLSSPQ
jgi:hypothetical protein